MRRSSLLPRLSLFIGFGLLGSPAAAESLSGVCPDGSIFIVKRVESVPCKNAKLVEPDEVPPIRPQYLPRPYAWQRFHQQQDPNNPYNLIDQAEEVRDPQLRDEPGQPAPPPRTAPQQASLAPPPVSAAPPRAPVVDLALGEAELRDLSMIVELSQQRAPASFSRGDDAAPTLVVRLAHSTAFESRVRAARGGSPTGPVVLFSAEAVAPETFHANLTFTQGHSAFHPDPADPRHFGLLRGGLGSIAAGESVLGYAVLPPGVDVTRPLDVYWNDHRLTTTLRP